MRNCNNTEKAAKAPENTGRYLVMPIDAIHRHYRGTVNEAAAHAKEIIRRDITSSSSAKPQKVPNGSRVNGDNGWSSPMTNRTSKLVVVQAVKVIELQVPLDVRDPNDDDMVGYS